MLSDIEDLTQGHVGAYTCGGICVFMILFKKQREGEMLLVTEERAVTMFVNSGEGKG